MELKLRSLSLLKKAGSRKATTTRFLKFARDVTNIYGKKQAEFRITIEK